MQQKIFSAVSIAITLLFILGLLAAQDQAAPPAPEAVAADASAAALVDQVNADLASLQRESNIAIIQSRLAADRAALAQALDQLRKR